MSGSVLVTGGAGFIGTETVDLLLRKGYEVIVLDNFEPEAHDRDKLLGREKAAEFRLVRGSVLDSSLMKELLQNIDYVIHLASLVGVSQSMYEIERYINNNTRGTATLLDVLVNTNNDVKKLVIASSASVYGEGKYFCEKCSTYIYPAGRKDIDLKKGIWEHVCPHCGTFLRPVSTDEQSPLSPISIYGMTKKQQEEMSFLIGRTYGIPTVALRYFNVYGPGQSLSNPYTGVCAIFSSRIINEKSPFIFEDGKQLRSFVHVRDVAEANILALERSAANYQAINIGSEKPTSILEIAETLINLYRSKLRPHVSNLYRPGDIRHYFPDMTKARSLLGFQTKITLEEGFRELVVWLGQQPKTLTEKFEKALKELEQRGLLNKKATNQIA